MYVFRTAVLLSEITEICARTQLLSKALVVQYFQETSDTLVQTRLSLQRAVFIQISACAAKFGVPWQEETLWASAEPLT